MSDITKIPALQYSQWSTVSDPNPRLAQPVSATGTTIYVTAPPLDKDGKIVFKAFLMGIKTSGYTETVYVLENGVQGYGNIPDTTNLGTTISGVTRGINLAGLDIATGSATRAIAHNQDSPIYFNISAIIEEMNINAIQGNIATGGNNLILGDETANNVTIKHKNNVTTVPWLRRNNSTGKPQFSNDGTNWVNIDSPGVGTLAAGRLIDSTQLAAGTVQVNDNYATATGAVNTFAVTITGLISPYTLGEKIRFKANLANTGAATLAVNGGAAKAIKKFNSTTALDADNIPLNAIVEVVYDGTNYQLMDKLAGLTSTVTQLNNMPTLVGGGDADALHIHSGALIASGGFATSSNANNASEYKDTTITITAGLTAGKIVIDISADIYGNTGNRKYWGHAVFNGTSTEYQFFTIYDISTTTFGQTGASSTVTLESAGTNRRRASVSVNSITESGNDVIIRNAYEVIATPGTNASIVYLTYKIYQA